MHVVLLGHGSRDPRHAETIRAIAAELNDRSLRSTVGAAFLDLCSPTLADAVGALPDSGEDTAGPARTYDNDDTVIVVPMLLTAAFHARVDVPAAVAAAQAVRPDTRFLVADVLGPSPTLVAAMARRLTEAGVDIDDPSVGVVVVAAGSSDEAARESVAEVAHGWLGRRATHAFAAGSGPTVGDALRLLVEKGATRVAVAPYLLASGVLPDRAFDDARRAGTELGIEVVVAAPIGDAPELLDLVPERARGAAS